MAESKGRLPVKGLLIHVSHYDPTWFKHKAEEGPFDSGVAVEAVEAMAEVGMNLLIVDCADGVKYRSHSELERHYTVPMRELAKVARAASKHGIDVVPKLNFSKSHWHHHDDWLGPHSMDRGWAQYEGYYKVADDLIAELAATCRPKRFFHIGMDEDHNRSYRQYVATIKRLRKVLKAHRLRAVIWNDSCHVNNDSRAQVHSEKCLAAEPLLPRDVVQMPWAYGRAYPSVVKRLAGYGFDVWVGAGGSLDSIRRWRQAVVANGGKGVVLTLWKKCDRALRADLLSMIRRAGPVLQ